MVSEYPTVILFDAKAKPLRTVIGFSWYEIATLYATQERIISGKGIKNLNIVSIFLCRIVLLVKNKCRLKWDSKMRKNKKGKKKMKNIKAKRKNKDTNKIRLLLKTYNQNA